MSVHVLPAEDADMDRIFEIMSLAFKRNEPIFNAFYPNHWTADGRKQWPERLRASRSSQQDVTFLKAVDTPTGQIVATAKWWILTDGAGMPSEESGSEYYESAQDEEFAKATGEAFLAKRNEAIRRNGGKLVSLDILAVDPAHQRRGVGDMLVKWGTGRADELGFEAVVESSAFGKGLYVKNGFVFQEDVHVEVPQFPDRPWGSMAWLVRPKKEIQRVHASQMMLPKLQSTMAAL